MKICFILTAFYTRQFVWSKKEQKKVSNIGGIDMLHTNHTKLGHQFLQVGRLGILLNVKILTARLLNKWFSKPISYGLLGVTCMKNSNVLKKFLQTEDRKGTIGNISGSITIHYCTIIHKYTIIVQLYNSTQLCNSTCLYNSTHVVRSYTVAQQRTIVVYDIKQLHNSTQLFNDEQLYNSVRQCNST